MGTAFVWNLEGGLQVVDKGLRLLLLSGRG